MGRTSRSSIKRRQLSIQQLENRKLLAADIMLGAMNSDGAQQWMPDESSELFSFAMPADFVLEQSPSQEAFTFVSEGFPGDAFDVQQPLGSSGILFGDLGTIQIGDFDGDFIDFDVDEWMEDAVEVIGIEDDVLELSPLEQAKEELQLYDADGDGKAVRTEIVASHVSLFGLRNAAAEGAADALLDAFDTNDDDALDVSELATDYYREQARTELEWLDKDADGVASEAEITEAYVEAFGIRESVAAGAAKGMVAAHDKNEDGGLDVDELMNSLMEAEPVEEAMPEADGGESTVANLDAQMLSSLFSSEDLAKALGVTVEEVGIVDAQELNETAVVESELVLEGDLSPEEIAEALGLSVDDIEFIEAENLGDSFTDDFVFDGDMTPEEIAKALGVGVDEIEFIDVEDMGEAMDGFEVVFGGETSIEEIAEKLGVEVDDIDFIDAENLDVANGSGVVLDGDMTQEEIAKALGVPIEDIEFIDAEDMGESVFDAVEIDVDGDLTPEELAEALGVSVEDIEFVNAKDMDEVELDGVEAIFTGDMSLEEIAKALGVDAEELEIVDAQDLEGEVAEIEFDGDMTLIEFDGDVTPGEIAEELGVPVDAIDFVDVVDNGEFEFDGIFDLPFGSSFASANVGDERVIERTDDAMQEIIASLFGSDRNAVFNLAPQTATPVDWFFADLNESGEEDDEDASWPFGLDLWTAGLRRG